MSDISSLPATSRAVSPGESPEDEVSSSAVAHGDALTATEQRRPPDAGPALLISVEEAAGLLRIGRTRCYQLIMAQRIRSVKVGKRRLVVRSGLEDFVSELEHAHRGS